MDIFVNVVNQKLRIPVNQKKVVAGTYKFIRYIFNLSNDWDKLKIFAQFQQENNYYDCYLDNEHSVYLPYDIKPGIFTITLYGSINDNSKIALTECEDLLAVPNNIGESDQSPEIPKSLYDELFKKVEATDDSIDLIEDRVLILENKPCEIHWIEFTDVE